MRGWWAASLGGLRGRAVVGAGRAVAIRRHPAEGRMPPGPHPAPAAPRGPRGRGHIPAGAPPRPFHPAEGKPTVHFKDAQTVVCVLNMCISIIN